MSNKILLHEKLKIYAENGGTVLINGKPHTALYPNEARDLAEEIERRYMPKPCDPEGNPWEVGQQCDWGTITILCWKGDEWLAEINGGLFLRDTESINRPVLDADGVACKREQKVWRLSDGEWFYVEELKPNGRLNLKQGGLGEMILDADPEDFTHREPDSLKRIARDAINALEDGDWHEAGVLNDRFAALIKRGA